MNKDPFGADVLRPSKTLFDQMSKDPFWSNVQRPFLIKCPKTLLDQMS